MMWPNCFCQSFISSWIKLSETRSRLATSVKSKEYSFFIIVGLIYQGLHRNRETVNVLILKLHYWRKVKKMAAPYCRNLEYWDNGTAEKNIPRLDVQKNLSWCYFFLWIFFVFRRWEYIDGKYLYSSQLI